VFLPERETCCVLEMPAKPAMKKDCASMFLLSDKVKGRLPSSTWVYQFKSPKFFNSSAGECSPEVWTLILPLKTWYFLPGWAVTTSYLKS